MRPLVASAAARQVGNRWTAENKETASRRPGKQPASLVDVAIGFALAWAPSDGDCRRRSHCCWRPALAG